MEHNLSWFVFHFYALNGNGYSHNSMQFVPIDHVFLVSGSMEPVTD
jgi:hypothetical protein